MKGVLTHMRWSRIIGSLNMNSGFSHWCAHLWLAESYSLRAIGSGNLRLALPLSCIWWDSLWQVLASMWSRATPIALALTWFWVGSFLLTQAADPAHHRGRHSARAEERSGLPLIRTKQPLVGQSCCSRFTVWLSNWGGGEGDEREDSKI